VIAQAVTAAVVLVVEDDPQAREMFRSALRTEGYSVVAVADGVAALKYLDTHKPEAVVLDLGLPRVDGRDVLADMAAQGLTDDVPVVIVTGDPNPLLDERDYACVLRKPIDAEQLIEAVRKCIRKQRMQPS
jgi:two-component system, OmpR family, response regulator MprA